MTQPQVPHRIHTERLVLRAYEVSDAEAMAAVMESNHERLREWLPWAWDEPQTIEARRTLLAMFRRKFDADEDYTMGIFDRRTGALLGGTGFHTRRGPGVLEIGYWLSADAEGKGYMQEAGAALTQVAFALARVPRVEIHCAAANVRSSRVPERLGYVLESSSMGTVTGFAEIQVAEYWALEADQATGTAAATAPRPQVFDADGAALEWPADQAPSTDPA